MARYDAHACDCTHIASSLVPESYVVPGLRVSVITGSLDELPRQDWDLDVLLTKPVNLSELLAAIRRLG